MIYGNKFCPHSFFRKFLVSYKSNNIIIFWNLRSFSWFKMQSSMSFWTLLFLKSLYILFETSSTNELKSTISILPVSAFYIPFQILKFFPSFLYSASVCKLYAKPVTSIISYIAHSLITCSKVKKFNCVILSFQNWAQFS